MAWKNEESGSQYLQIMDNIRLKIATGQYPPGGRMPAPRELANEASVNPNTMLKAYTELENEGCIVIRDNKNVFVTDEPDALAAVKSKLTTKQKQKFFVIMSDLGYTREEIEAIIK